MAFQELEELVSCLISQLISDDAQLGTIVTAELSFRNKLGLLYSLYLYRAAVSAPPEIFKALLGKLHGAAESRISLKRVGVGRISAAPAFLRGQA